MASQTILFIIAGGGFLQESRTIIDGFDLTNNDCHFVTAKACEYATRGFPPKNCHIVTQTTSITQTHLLSRIKHLFRSFIDARQLLKQLKPDAIICVGSSMAVPFFVLANNHTKRIFIESLTRVTELSTTGKLIYHTRLNDRFYVQWDLLKDKYNLAIFKGNLI